MLDLHHHHKVIKFQSPTKKSQIAFPGNPASSLSPLIFGPCLMAGLALSKHVASYLIVSGD